MHSLKVRVLNRRAAAPLDAPRGAIYPVAHASAQPELELATLPLHQQNDLLPCSQHRQISVSMFLPSMTPAQPTFRSHFLNDLDRGAQRGTLHAVLGQVTVREHNSWSTRSSTDV